MSEHAPALSPVAARDRIDTLDVLRGFALVGICVVNVEFFNRPVVESGDAIPPGLAGIDWFTAFFVNYFISGKFWSIFSLLFGMGFALMLERAGAAGQSFLRIYLRRIAVLGVFGLLHHTLLWEGDILVSYTVGALMLVLTLLAPARLLVGAILLCLALAAVAASDLAGALATPLVFAGLVALYLRAPPGKSLFPLLTILPGGLMLLAALLQALAGDGEGVREAAMTGALLLLLGLLARRYAEPAAARLLRAGVAILVACYGLLALSGALQLAAAGSGADGAAGLRQEAASAEQEQRQRERLQRGAEEREVLTSGSYADAVAMRARHLERRLGDETIFGVLLVGVFLVGTWFVRAGLLRDARAHLPLFRRLALFGIPGGLLLGLAGGLLATGRTPGGADPGYELAHGLLMLGSLPASLGYVALVVLLLHGGGRAARIRVLAPFGRMALTHYLTQSLVLSLLFYGYGAGLWGMGRTAQVAVALALCALQVLLSHWWLARFSQGPVEWLWRALTYGALPAWRKGWRQIKPD